MQVNEPQCSQSVGSSEAVQACVTLLLLAWRKVANLWLISKLVNANFYNFSRLTFFVITDPQNLKIYGLLTFETPLRGIVMLKPQPTFLIGLTLYCNSSDIRICNSKHSLSLREGFKKNEKDCLRYSFLVLKVRRKRKVLVGILLTHHLLNGSKLLFIL